MAPPRHRNKKEKGVWEMTGGGGNHFLQEKCRRHNLTRGRGDEIVSSDKRGSEKKMGGRTIHPNKEEKGHCPKI